jgi:putative membrane protein
LLAWLRTGLAVVGIGFLVARFGLFLAVVRGAETGGSRAMVSGWIGVGFVLLGTMMIGATTWQHVQFCRQLLPEERPQRYSIRFSQIIALLVTVLCMALAAYLLVTTGQG